MKKETIVLDIDGVVLRWNSRLIEFLKRKNIRILNYIAKIIKENKFLNIKELDKYFKQGFLHSYHTSPEAALLDQNYKDLDKLLSKLSQKYNIVALTAFSLDPKAQENRKNNLELHFPNIFSKIYYVDTLSSKRIEILKLSTKYNIKLFVDDSKRHIKDALPILGEDKVFLMKKPKQWKDLEKILMP